VRLVLLDDDFTFDSTNGCRALFLGFAMSYRRIFFFRFFLRKFLYLQGHLGNHINDDTFHSGRALNVFKVVVLPSMLFPSETSN